MDILTTIAICLALSLLFSEIFRRLGYPEVVGQILVGVILGLPVMAVIFSTDFLTDIEFLSQLGIIFLLLLAGLEINMNRLEKLSKAEFLVAFFSALVPFLLGFFGMRLLSYDTLAAIVVGACLSITAEGTTLKVLMDMDQLNTKIGTIILGAGILDDVLEVFLLAILLIIVQNPSIQSTNWTSVAFFPFMVVAFVLVCLILFRFVPRLMRFIQREHSRVANFSMVMVLGIGVAALSQFFGLGPIIGAFIAGILIHWVNKDKKEMIDIVDELKVMTFSLIIPFFFIYIGLHFDYQSLFDHTGLILFILFIAIFGKILGSLIAKFFMKDISLKQAFLIGWGMNSRGAIELVIAEIARANALIPPHIYSAIVIMAVVTTIIFPGMMKLYLKKDPEMMKS